MKYFEYIFIYILNMSITASYAAIAIIIARQLLKKAPKVFSYSLWSVVLFRLICPFSFSSEFSLLRLIKPVQTTLSSISYIPDNPGLMETPTLDLGVDSVNTYINSLLPSATPYQSVNPMQILIMFGTIIWLLGIAVMVTYAFLSYLNLKKKICTATIVSDNVYETDLIKSPFVYGLLRPKIYLPLFLNGCERKYILCHEKVHIKRLDFIVKPIAFMALTLHWFNPVIWLCFLLMSKDMEMSCDESVMKQRVNVSYPINEDPEGPTSVFYTDMNVKADYSNSLLSLAINRKFPSPSPLAFGESNVKSRIKNVLKYKKPTFLVIAASVTLLIVLVISLISNPANGNSASKLNELFSDSNNSGDTKSEYKIEALIENKTQYIGNNSKVSALVGAMPVPDGVSIRSIELSTAKEPYGLIIYYNVENPKISEEHFLKNSVLLFALIDNVQTVTHNYKGNSDSTASPFNYIHSRSDTEKIVNGDVRQFAKDRKSLEELISIVQSLNSNKKTAFKGLELYVWRKTELAGNSSIYYTLLPGTNRNKTEEEIFNLSVATNDIKKIQQEILTYDEAEIFVSHPQSITKNEIEKIVDQIKPKSGSVHVGTGWFKQMP